MHLLESYVRQALEAGAAGYLLKSAAGSELVAALESVRNGGSYFSAPVSRMIVEGYLETSKAATVEKLSVLTPREREVLQLIAEGNSYKEIAVGAEDQPEDRRPASRPSDAEAPLPSHSRAREVCFARRRNAGLRISYLYC